MTLIRKIPTRHWEMPVLLAFPLFLAILSCGYIAVTLWPPDGLVDPWWSPEILFGLFVLGGVSLGLLAAWRYGSADAGEPDSGEPREAPP